MATSTYKSFLMHGTGSTTLTWSKLVDITDYPDLGGDPEMLDRTTLSEPAKTYILGIQNNEGLAFNANYDPVAYQALDELKGETEKYAVWFGGTESNGEVTPTGSEGKFTFDGQLNVRVTGGGVNEVRKMAINIAPSTPIVPSFSS